MIWGHNLRSRESSVRDDPGVIFQPTGPPRASLAFSQMAQLDHSSHVVQYLKFGYSMGIVMSCVKPVGVSPTQSSAKHSPRAGPSEMRTRALKPKHLFYSHHTYYAMPL